ncbi:MAG TPA: transposase [Steroidobacteraceae bacterium]|nr:transposase [Steroidobacteraceae bacterium]
MRQGKRERKMPRTRQNRPAKQKAAALRKHLVEKVALSDVCEEIGLQPSVFYTWQKQLFGNRSAQGLGWSLTSGRRRARDGTIVDGSTPTGVS